MGKKGPGQNNPEKEENEKIFRQHLQFVFGRICQIFADFAGVPHPGCYFLEPIVALEQGSPVLRPRPEPEPAAWPEPAAPRDTAAVATSAMT